MTKTTIAGLAAAGVLLVLALVAGFRALERDSEPAAETSPVPSTAAAEAHPSFLYGRVTTLGGATYEGRLRWGRDQEAFWGDYFNGVRTDNPWAVHVPPERLSREGGSIEILGIKIPSRGRQIDLGRPFMARFGDIARIEAVGATNVRVTLKNGTVTDLNRSDASDFDDGVRVWDGRRGVVDVDSMLIRSIELLPADRSAEAPYRLHGTVETRQGDFTGFVQWDRQKGLGRDQLDGRAAGSERSLRFDTIRSIARESRDSSRVTLRDGREIVLSSTRAVGRDNRGIYVDDPRYGRVLISWDAFERVDFGEDGAGPAYGDFPPGHPLTGSVTTRDGRRLAGRLVYDLDESETTETLDAPSYGVNYAIPFGLIVSLWPHGREERGARSARVILHSGEELQLERTGDLGDVNGGMLIFAEGRHPEYVPWTDIEQIDFARPPAMYPPISGNQTAGTRE